SNISVWIEADLGNMASPSGWSRRLEESLSVTEKIAHAFGRRPPSRDQPQHGHRGLAVNRKIAHAGGTKLTDRFGHEGHADAGSDEADHRGHLRRFLHDARAEPGTLACRDDRVVEQTAVGARGQNEGPVAPRTQRDPLGG